MKIIKKTSETEITHSQALTMTRAGDKGVCGRVHQWPTQ
jgi:hypothetical protein